MPVNFEAFAKQFGKCYQSGLIAGRSRVSLLAMIVLPRLSASPLPSHRLSSFPVH
jgi:hypothetical protein